MGLLRRLGTTYARIWRTYVAWMPALLLLGLVVFVPLGLLHSLLFGVEVGSLNLDSGIKVAAVLLGISAIVTTGLLGEVFFSGVVAVFLTHPEHGRRPPVRQIARQLSYGRLIAVDVLYVAVVTLGAVAFLVPGVLAFVLLGLAGPIVELEDRPVREALGRSVRLIRGNFWFAFWILVPIEIVGDAAAEAVTSGVHALLGHSLLAGWLAETGSNVVLSPFFAVAAVLLTIDLIQLKDGDGPRLNSEPAPA